MIEGERMISVVTAILYFVKDVFAVFNLLVIMRFIFLEKLLITPNKIALLILFTAANSIIGVFFLKTCTDDFDSIMDFISNVLYIVFVFLMTEKVKTRKIILTVFVCIYTVDMFWALISSYAGANLIIEYAVNIAAFSAVGTAIYCLCSKSRFGTLSGVINKIPAWVFIMLLLFELTCYYKEFGVSAQWYKALYFISSAGIVICIFYMLFKVSQMAFKQNEIFNRMEAQKKLIEKQYESDEELRRFRHDYKNHMIVISSLLTSGKTDEAAAYANELGEITCENGLSIQTGNMVADALINQKASEAAKIRIKIDFIGFIPSKCIDDVDLCTILSNIIDNAVEATGKCKSARTITIESNLVKTHLLLTVSNPCLRVQKYKNGRLKTTKQDRINHGIGLKNVERIVEKYNGAVLYEQENGMFISNIRMIINNAEKVKY